MRNVFLEFFRNSLCKLFRTIFQFVTAPPKILPRFALRNMSSIEILQAVSFTFFSEVFLRLPMHSFEISSRNSLGNYFRKMQRDIYCVVLGKSFRCFTSNLTRNFSGSLSWSSQKVPKIVYRFLKFPENYFRKSLRKFLLEFFQKILWEVFQKFLRKFFQKFFRDFF